MPSAFIRPRFLSQKFTTFIAVVFFIACLLMGRSAQAQIINTIAGDTGSGFTGDNRLATNTSLYLPQGVAVDKWGNVFIADTWNNRVRKIDVATGIISTYAGSGTLTADGVRAIDAELYQPIGIAIDDSDYVFVTDGYRNRVRKISPSTGYIYTVAGKGNTSPAFSGDGGPGTQAEFFSPFGLALDDTGNVYITDEANNRVRKVDKATGIIHTIAGNGVMGYAGDGLAATSAELRFPTGVAIDKAGNIFVTQSMNGVIREINGATGIITTIAGNGIEGFAGDGGLATQAEFNNPAYIVLDDSDNLYVGDLFNAAVRKIRASTGIVTTVAGDTTWGFSGDGGPATSAELNEPSGLAMDACHNLYITERGNNRVRKVTIGSAPFISFTASSTTACTGQVVSFTDTNNIKANQWNWQFTGGTPATSTVQHPTVVYNTTGQFSVSLLATGSCGRASEIVPQYFQVNQSPVLTISPVVTAICQNKSLMLTATGADNYQWVGTGNNTNTITVSPAKDTTYTLHTSDGSCNTDSVISVKVNANPSVTIQPPSPSYCFGTGAHFTANGGDTYSWSPSTGLSATTGSNIIANPSSSTTYTIVATSTAGCTASATDALTIFPAPTISYSYSNNGLTVNFTSDSATGGVSIYTWDFGDSTGTAHGATTHHTYSKAGNYYSCLTVYNNSNCSYTRCQYVDLTKTGVQDISGEINFMLYPNPVSGELTLSGEQLAVSSIEITNLLGQTLITQIPSPNSKQTVIDVGSLSSGVYLLVVKSNDGVGVKKFVKE